MQGFVGQAPNVLVRPINPEAAKYQKLWGSVPGYRAVSPGEQMAMTFLKQASPEKDAEVIDFGCGTGRGALMLAAMGGMRVTMLDFAENCLDPEVAQACETQPTRISFRAHDLIEPPAENAAYGYCCDVMEHIPTADVPKVLRNILGSAHHVFFGISTVPDVMGKTIGQDLHLTVKPLAWWIKQITDLGAIVHWSKSLDGYCLVYCSGWQDAGELVKTGVINVTDEVINEQVRQNIEAGWTNVMPRERQEREVILLAGGPSMRGQLDKIRELRADRWCLRRPDGTLEYWGHDAKPEDLRNDYERALHAEPLSYPSEQEALAVCAYLANDYAVQVKPVLVKGAALVTVNGAYGWAIEHGLVPSVQIVLDARPFNARFMRPLDDTCQYLVASQCHPSTLEGLPRERTQLWHTMGISEANEALLAAKDIPLFPVPGGSTVVLRALPLMRMLGLTQFHLFGFDSCVLPDAHHAYPQPENDHVQTIPITCGGRTFECVPWQASQASEFRDLVQVMGDELELAVYGDGLIKHILTTGASFSSAITKD